MSAPPSFTCATCGGTHEGLPTDFSFTLPDDVWAIPADERDERANWSSEFCDFGERRFVRCYLEIPFVGRDETFRFSAWVEVTPVRSPDRLEGDANERRRHLESHGARHRRLRRRIVTETFPPVAPYLGHTPAPAGLAHAPFQLGVA